MPGPYDAIAVDPTDRILLLALPAERIVRDLALRASHGIIVGIGSEDAVYEMRCALSDLHNVMFVPAAERLEIPWREEYFTKIIAFEHRATEPEMLRVLVPGGTVYLDGSVVTKEARA